MQRLQNNFETTSLPIVGSYQKAEGASELPRSATTVVQQLHVRTTVTRKLHGEIRLRYVPAKHNVNQYPDTAS